MEHIHPLLKLKGIGKAFGPRLLFRRIDVSLFPGTLSLLAGANGVGKSTLMRVMAGLSKADAGSVLCAVSPEKLGYMGHATFLYPGLEAEENLLFWARAMGIENALSRVRDALESVGLARHAHEKAGIFSRGMAQRLNLARLLLNEPELILLDEPSTGLDISSRRMLMELMLQARSRGSAIVWISHDMAEDSRYADRVLILEKHSLREEAGALSC